MAQTGFFTEALGQAAYAFNEVQPYLPMYLHLIISALFPIFTGAHASLVRPSSAAKAPKNNKKERGNDVDDDEDEDEDDESLVQKMEGLSPSDAIVFPVLAGSTLAGLYFLIKWMGPEVINKFLGWYFSCIAVFSVAKLLNDGFAVVESFCWPNFYADEGVIWRVKSSERTTTEISDMQDSVSCRRSSPLPGILGRMRLSPATESSLWFLRELPTNRFSIRAHIATVVSFRLKLTLRTIFSTLLALAAVLVSHFVSKAWWLTNLQGFAFSYSALQLISPTTFGTGSLILAALFFYDIYFVFYTPLMVTVATKLDVPIKLLFPRPAEEGETIRRLAMLGLGDIVLPGIMIGLALRFDLYMHYLKKQTKQTTSAESDVLADEKAKQNQQQTIHKERYRSVVGHWGDKFWTSSWTGRSLLFVHPPPGVQQSSPSLRNASIPTFSKPYFYASIAGYIVGMCATLGIMQVYHHAQPALLYLVPGVLLSLWSTGLIRGELKQMHEFSEASEEEINEGEKSKATASESKNAKKDDKKKSDKDAKPSCEHNAKVLEKRLATNFSNDEQTSNDASSDEKKSKAEKEDVVGGKEEKKQRKTSDAPKEFFLFSITHIPPPGSKRAKARESDHVAVNGDADVSSADHIPRWTGSRVREDSQEDRPEKRIRTS
ncbi:signal peptide peptidase-domain-containing protein [Delphinella strobiligena]|nr:signal peptide peptidase-domain-containing protein [Delphinella strobiligena]